MDEITELKRELAIRDQLISQRDSTLALLKEQYRTLAADYNASISRNEAARLEQQQQLDAAIAGEAATSGTLEAVSGLILAALRHKIGDSTPEQIPVRKLHIVDHDLLPRVAFGTPHERSEVYLDNFGEEFESELHAITEGVGRSRIR